MISNVDVDHTNRSFVHVTVFLQEVLREDDAKLQALRGYGEEAYAAVTKALIDLNTGNGSRRTPNPVLWNSKEDRKAMMKEAAQHAVQLWKASKSEGRGRALSSINTTTPRFHPAYRGC